MPLTTYWFGYFAGRRLGTVGDLPQGVIWQWRRWCLSSTYSAGAEGEAARKNYADVRFPLRLLHMTDDEMMTLEGTQVLLDLYCQAPRKIECIAPSDFGVESIGHFRFFRQQFSQTLWPLALERLLAFKELPGASYRLPSRTLS